MNTDAKKDSRTKESDRTDSQANVLMPDIYADEPASNKIDTAVVDESPPDADESIGFNPYDTAVFQKK